MIIKKVPISEVDVWEKNPRNIKTKDFERLKRQIQKLGIYKPLICVKENGKYITLGGNMRLRALQALNYQEVDISIVNAPDEAIRIEYALSDNDRAGTTEEQKLAELIYPYIKDINLEDFKVDVGEPWLDLKRVVEHFGPDLDPGAEWKDMPEFNQKYEGAVKEIVVKFLSIDDYYDFSRLIRQRLTKKTHYIYYPKQEIKKPGIYKDES